MSHVRAGLVSLAVWLGGCVAGPLEGGRYACVIDGGEDQCPDAWRCGFEGYCHPLGDISTQWRCETDLHCENGWKCGLDESRDGGACHDPAKKAPHACFEDSQCTGGWHCGPEGRCYDRAVPASHLCRAGAGDCADNWRCGLNGRCQNQDAGAPYACLGDAGPDDLWCEQGWRCAPEGQCLDPRNDALAAGLLPVKETEKIHPHPSSSSAGIERFSVSQSYETGFGAGRQTVAFVQGRKLRARVLDTRGVATFERYELGPWNGVALAALGNRGELTAFPFFPDEKARIFVALDGGAVDVITLGADGGFSREDMGPVDFTNRLTVGTAAAGFSPRVMAFSSKPDYYTRFVGGAGEGIGSVFREQETTLRFDEALANNALVDAVSVRPFEFMECIFAADKRGLWVAQRAYQNTMGPPSSYDFEPVEVPGLTNDFCRAPVAGTQRITQLAPSGREWLGVASTGLDGGSPNVAVLDLRALWTRNEPDAFCTTINDQACLPSDRIPVDPRMGPCPVCTGGRLMDFALVPDSTNQPTVEVHCQGLDGGNNSFFILTRSNMTGECTRAIADGESGIFSKSVLVSPEHPTAGQVAWASTDGFIWTGTSSRNVTSELLDRAPTVLARRGAQSNALVAFARDINASFEPNFGFTATPGSIAVAGVSHRPEWIITKDRLVLDLGAPVGDSQLLGLIGDTLNPFSAPHLATTAKSASATVLVMSAGSSVFAAEMDARLNNQQPYAPLSLKLVSPSQIDSLAFPQSPFAGAYLRGYAVTPNGLLRLTAQTSSRWSFEEIPLPALLVPQEVWFEGDRGRVGFTDGTVYSLPSRVPIAGPLAEGVVDYAQICGQQLALGPSNLYRLEAQPGSSVGLWKELTLAAGFAAPNAFLKGRIHAVGSAIYVFKRSGETARLTFESCPAP